MSLRASETVPYPSRSTRTTWNRGPMMGTFTTRAPMCSDLADAMEVDLPHRSISTNLPPMFDALDMNPATSDVKTTSPSHQRTASCYAPLDDVGGSKAFHKRSTSGSYFGASNFSGSLPSGVRSQANRALSLEKSLAALDSDIRRAGEPGSLNENTVCPSLQH